MRKQMLGKTGLEVTPLGFGTAQIGFVGMSQHECHALLNGVLDSGIGVIDTAACYVDAEEKVGKAIGDRRDEYVLVSKCGHHVEESDPPEWSPEIVRKSTERSLRLLKTDRLDVLLIHSCPQSFLENDALIEALLEVREAGLVRFVGYSGDREDLDYAVGLKGMECIETSLSLFDQQVLDSSLPRAEDIGLGVFLKRPLGNSVWRDMTKYGGPYGGYTSEYTRRYKAMNFTPESVGFEGEWDELALRFALSQPGVSCALVGGMNLHHVHRNVEIAGMPPLPESVVEAVRAVWKAHDDGSWVGQT